MASKKQTLDHYFLDARHAVIEVAAFLDRVDRSDGDDDFRIRALRAALPTLLEDRPDRARAILEALSDTSTEPIPEAVIQGAHGAPPDGQ